MGLLKHLLFWPVTGPSYLTRFSLEKVEGAVKTELTDDAVVKRDLMELQMELELGDIDEDEYVEREAALMRQLRRVRHWREQFGMPTSGGLVQVAEEPGDQDAVDEGRERERNRDQEPEGPSVARPDAADVDITLDFDED